MAEPPKIGYRQLEAGDELPPSSYKLDSAMVVAYLRAVEETSGLYQDTSLVPPMAVAAYALAALLQGLSLPPGAIHVSQELEFIAPVSVDDNLTSYARLSRKQSRGQFCFLTFDLNVCKPPEKAVMTGKTSLMLPA